MNIYFLQSYVGIKQLLTLIDSQRENIIFYNTKELGTFLDLIKKEYNIKKVYLTEIKKESFFSLIYPKDKETYFQESIQRLRLDYSKIENIYYFCDIYTLNYFILLSKLPNEKIIYIDTENNKIILEQKVKFNSIKNSLYLIRNKIQSYLLNVDLDSLYWRDHILVRLKKNYGIKRKKNIDNLKKKINLKKFEDNVEKKILYLEQPLELLNLCIDETLKNIKTIFKKYEKEGYIIAVKLHPRSKNENFYSEYEIIDKEIPVEFLSQNYKEYLTITSTGILEFLKNNKNCKTLIEEVVFKSDNFKNIQKKYLENFLENNGVFLNPIFIKNKE